MRSLSFALYKRSLALILAVAITCGAGLAQDPPADKKKPTFQPAASQHKSPESDIAVKKLPSNLWNDQKRIWTSPVRLRAQDLKWAIPLTFAAGLTFGVDHAVERKLPTSASTVSHASTASNAGAALFAGVVAGQYLWGLKTHNEKLRETGFLSGEAAIDATGLAYLGKSISRRERPADGTGQGRFFKSTPMGSSFPSEHAAAAWAIATVIAQEYPGIATKIVAYGGASAVGAARIVGDKHFASDVLLGSALGYFVGRQVYGAHAADAKLDRMYGTFEKRKNPRDPSLMASPYVPLESWVYAAFDRLNAMGFTRNAVMGQRPWTRKQCAQLIDDVDQESVEAGSGVAKELLASLRTEFQQEGDLLKGHENFHGRVEEVYTRFTGISGPPLRDELHFGQTIINDYGRPYAEGFNQVTGLSAHAEAGPLAFYVRGEYQHAGSTPGYPLSTRNAIAAQDQLPVMPGNAFPGVDRVRLLDSYVALNVRDWQLSFGKQSLWWGPGAGGDLMLANNAEPITMLRLQNVAPMTLPSVLGILGPFSNTTFLGQTGGYHFLLLGPTFQTVGSWNTFVDPQPYVFGEHLSFKPTANLEFGVSMTTVLGGLGRPMTLQTFKHSFSGNGNFQNVEPGDRRTGFDFSYRIPGLRNWLTLYNGSMAEDEINPIAYPRRSSMNPGIYLARLPGFEKADLRVEGVYSDIPNELLTGIVYTNRHYAGGYTNQGQVMASWIGPEARGLQIQSNYWMSPERKLAIAVRSQTVNPAFINGGDLKDFGVQYTFKTARELTITSGVQYETWKFPALAADRKSNLVLSVQFSWMPSKARR